MVILPKSYIGTLNINSTDGDVSIKNNFNINANVETTDGDICLSKINKLTVKSDDAGAVDTSYLSDVLKYVVPVGYTVSVTVNQTQTSSIATYSSRRRLKAKIINQPKVVKQQLIKF